MSIEETIIVRRMPFVKAVATSLRQQCGVEPGDRLLIAVSGGGDSVALMRALVALGGTPEWDLDLHIAHIQHHLRDDAEADAAFVEALAAQFGMPLHRRDVTIDTAAGNVEAEARKLRYRALADIAGAIDADAVAAAHHADDQLETILMRLLRGAALRGLSGMAVRRRLGTGRLIRPMLDCTRSEAVGFLEQIDQPWRDDHTNTDIARWRARLRADVLPVLMELRADAPGKANQAAQRLRAADELLALLTRRLERRHVSLTDDGSATLGRDVARKMQPELLGRVIQRQCRKAGVSADQISMRLIDAIGGAVRDGSGERRTFDLAGGCVVEVSSEAIVWRGGSA